MTLSHTQPRTLTAVRSRKGFSLVEILVVVAIIAVLAAIAVPVAGNITRGSKLKKNKEIVTTLQLAIDKFHAEYGYLPAVSDSAPSEDETFSDQELVDILLELEGKEDTLIYNTKGINFLEGVPEGSSGIEGIQRSNGKISGINNAMGETVFARLDYSYDKEIDAPSNFGGREVKGVHALVWTYGFEGEQASEEKILDDASASWR